jgi:starch synthase
MRLLFVTSEVEPFSKTGGLGDVLGALPKALAERGHEVIVVSPRYHSLDQRKMRLEATQKWISVRFPFGEQYSQIWVAHPPNQKNLRYAFIEHALFYERAGIYGDAGGDYGDNARRFAYLSRGAIEVARALDFTPDILHAHDWPTGLAPLYLLESKADLRFKKTKSVFTIHNLGYQGVFDKGVMGDLGLSWSNFTPEGFEFYDSVNFLKAGIGMSDHITTVSRRYAEEIQTPEQGWGLDLALRSRRHRLTGILNGADYSEWNPASDSLIPERFDRENLEGKARCRHALLETFGLRASGNTMVIGLVTRLAYQKGAELVLLGSRGLMDRDIALVLLGNGDPSEEEGFRQLSRIYQGRVGVHLGFDRRLSHMVIAGSDVVVMPSRYEPCGLTQLYGLRYGAVPVVRATGGLDDTVIDATQPDGNGFKFGPFNPGALVEAVSRAAWQFRHPEVWSGLVRRGMSRDYSWNASSQRYETLYRELLEE